MKRNDFPESIGINRKMTGNDRKNDRITTGNDRKRPKMTAGSPFGSATSRNGFLGNSPIFRAFSSKFPDFPRNSLIFHGYSIKFHGYSIKFHGYSIKFRIFSVCFPHKKAPDASRTEGSEILTKFPT